MPPPQFSRVNRKISAQYEGVFFLGTSFSIFSLRLYSRFCSCTVFREYDNAVRNTVMHYRWYRFQYHRSNYHLYAYTGFLV